jgi:malonate transporter and related proteins
VWVVLATLHIVFPVFALVIGGFVTRRRGLLGPAAASELNRFVVWLALPALMFDVLWHTTRVQIDQPGFLVAFSLALMVPFALICVIQVMRGKRLVDGAIDALAAAYPNTAYMGIPLAAAMFGPSGLLPAMLASILLFCLQFGTAVVLIEIGLQAEQAPHLLLFKVLGKLARNPLIVAPLLGAVASVMHLSLPEGGETLLKLVGAAAAPVALVSLGAFLAEKRPAEGALGAALVFSAVKLFLQPLFAWGVGVLLHLPDALLVPLVVLAAMPTGTGPYMLAELYDREPHVTSRTILISTLGSLLTLAWLLPYLTHA